MEMNSVPHHHNVEQDTSNHGSNAPPCGTPNPSTMTDIMMSDMEEYNSSNIFTELIPLEDNNASSDSDTRIDGLVKLTEPSHSNYALAEGERSLSMGNNSNVVTDVLDEGNNSFVGTQKSDVNSTPNGIGSHVVSFETENASASQENSLFVYPTANITFGDVAHDTQMLEPETNANFSPEATSLISQTQLVPESQITSETQMVPHAQIIPEALASTTVKEIQVSHLTDPSQAFPDGPKSSSLKEEPAPLDSDVQTHISPASNVSEHDGTNESIPAENDDKTATIKDEDLEFSEKSVPNHGLQNFNFDSSANSMDELQKITLDDANQQLQEDDVFDKSQEIDEIQIKSSDPGDDLKQGGEPMIDDKVS